MPIDMYTDDRERISRSASNRQSARRRAQSFARGESGVGVGQLRNCLRDATGSGIFRKTWVPKAHHISELACTSEDYLLGMIRTGIQTMFGPKAPVNGEMCALRERVATALYMLTSDKPVDAAVS